MAKTKALISFAVTAKLICAFVFAYADCWLSHVVAQMFPETEDGFSGHSITSLHNRMDLLNRNMFVFHSKFIM